MYSDQWEGAAIFRILHNMRASDCHEIFALRPERNVDRLFAEMQFYQPNAPFLDIVYKPDFFGMPCAFLLITLDTPGVGRASMIATDEMRPRDFAMWAKRLREITPGVCAEAGLHRLHCSVLASHVRAKHFLKHLGWFCEGFETALGKNGEDFERWVALAGDFDLPMPSEEK